VSRARVALGRPPRTHALSPQAKRWGRGDGGDRGTYCGRGVKGQKARKGNKPGLLFDGGQKTLKKFPKVWLKPRCVVRALRVVRPTR
jgi:ribosomal protein L15